MKINIGKFPKRGYQKAKIQIDNWDTWSLDHTLARIIYPALLQLKESKHGVPGGLVEDVGGEDYSDQESFDFYKDTHDDSWDEAAKKWDVILDKMIWSFQQLADNDYDKKYHHGEAKFDWIKSDRTYPNPVTGKIEPTYQMVDKNPTEHWYDHVGHRLHEERIQEGLELFGKYYRSLWD